MPVEHFATKLLIEASHISDNDTKRLVLQLCIIFSYLCCLTKHSISENKHVAWTTGLLPALMFAKWLLTDSLNTERIFKPFLKLARWTGLLIAEVIWIWLRFPGGSEVKVSACNEGDLGSILGSGRSPGEGNGNPLQYSCLENPMDRGAWWATVHGVAQSRTRLKQLSSNSIEYLAQALLSCPVTGRHQVCKGKFSVIKKERRNSPKDENWWKLVQIIIINIIFTFTAYLLRTQTQIPLYSQQHFNPSAINTSHIVSLVLLSIALFFFFFHR